MQTVLVTGAKGFIGSNLVVWLKGNPNYQVLEFDTEKTEADLAPMLASADLVVHLAGVNRPQHEAEFKTGNVDLTAQICTRLLELGRALPILFSSSIQADLDNPYGVSKRQAEEVLSNYAQRSGARVVIFRLTNVFGKWCKPNYNSVVATFCHNIARDLPVAISDPNREIDFIHVDDVIRCFMEELGVSQPGGLHYRSGTPSYPVTLGRLAELLHSFRRSRQSLLVPEFSDPFTHKLYGTFLSYLPPDDFAYDLTQRTDPRGSLAEFVKSPTFGQIFVSRTKPGITRGNHYHHTKTEKFLVLEGEAVIRFRHMKSNEVIEYAVRGEDYRVLDIPTGYTHSIENVGNGELVTLFWASEIFDPEHPDTGWEEVLL
jgi:UDP-2-acetamido-2,6-beta-L-arabino-hexul-4-ose reductase